MKTNGSKLFSSVRVILGVAWAKSSRDYMEDAFSLRLSCHKEKNELDFFGVFDGHGPSGDKVSAFVAYNLFDSVNAQLSVPGTTLPRAIEDGCLTLDDALRSVPELMDRNKKVEGGTTACAVWIRGSQIFSANIGDSRFIVSYKGMAVQITDDHKPFAEETRIFKAGGFVTDDGRVNGILGVARSFGDFMFKTKRKRGPHKQIVTVVPDVRTVNIDENIDFLVLATDGVWDEMQNQQVVDFVMERMEQSLPLNEICKAVLKKCDCPTNASVGPGSDNMTVIVAILR